MLIEIKDHAGRPRDAVQVDLSDPPAVVSLPRGQPARLSLDWDRAIDDEQHLRHCPVCGCEALYARKRVPQVTIFALIIAAAAIALVVFGLGEVTWALLVLGLVVILDAAIFFFARRALVCYRCWSEFRGQAIRRDHPGWDPATAERYRAEGRPRILQPAGDEPAEPQRAAGQVVQDKERSS